MHAAIAIWALVLAGDSGGGKAGGPAEDSPEVLRTISSYEISFLTREVPDFPMRSRPSAGELLLRKTGIRSGAAEEGAISIGFKAEEESEGVRFTDKEIIDLICANIAEDSWANERNSIEVRGSRLLVFQTPDVQEEIGRLLAVLRARRARMFKVEAAVVPAGCAGEAGEGPWFPEDRLDEALRKAGDRGSRIALLAYNEQTVSGSTGRKRAAVVRNDFNSTGVIPTRRPDIEDLPLGLTAEAAPLAVVGAGLVRLRLEVARITEEGEAPRRVWDSAEFELPSLEEESLRSVLYLPPGRTFLAGTFTDASGGGEARRFAVLARARRSDVQAEPPPRDAPAGFHLRLYDISVLLDRPADPENTIELLENLIHHNVDPDVWNDERARISLARGRLLQVTAPGKTHEEVRAYIDRLIRERARLAAVEVSIFEGPADAVLRIRRAAAGGELPLGWEATADGKLLRERLRASLAGALGEELRAAGFRSRRFVKDVEVVSGGTKYTIVPLAVPIIGSAGDGFLIRARASPALDPERLLLKVLLAQTRTDIEGSITVLAPSGMGSPAARAPEEGRPILPPSERFWRTRPCSIDLPRQDEIVTDFENLVPAGRPVIIGISDGGPGIGRLVVASARALAAPVGR